jgi:hypothetical protein
MVPTVPKLSLYSEWISMVIRRTEHDDDHSFANRA